MAKIKSFSEYIKEDINQDISNARNAYNKSKSRVIAFANDKAKDATARDKAFNDFLNTLSEQDKSANDLLRILYSSEKMRLSIDEMKQKKIDIDKEITLRTQELNDMKTKLG